MSFIEEIQPYIDRIKLHQKGGNITNIETLRAIRDIHFKYIRFKDFDTPSNLGCGNCVRQMINQLVGERGRSERILNDILADPVHGFIKPTLNEKGKKMTYPKQEPVTFDGFSSIIKEVPPTNWREFQKYCKDKGLKSGGKTREVLENELKGL